ncbi:MAG: transglutaminase family protein [Pirellulales bacterium]
MPIRVALHHRTEYRYGQVADLGPQVIRLRPAAHCRTRVMSYALKVEPSDHFLNWQQDPYGNFLARVVVPQPIERMVVEIDLTAEMTVINPFDFFLEPDAEFYPFTYSPDNLQDLVPFLHVAPVLDGSPLAEYVRKVDCTRRKTIDFLVDLNQQVHRDVKYLIRMEPGVQSCDETLAQGSGSCRDSAWLLVNVLRRMGLAARFASGYIIQLKADAPPLDGAAGAAEDFTDLHAWAEVFLPGAGWVGLDATSGLLAGEGHIPLACTPEPISAAPITGTASLPAEDFQVHMTVSRIHEDPRVTKPYTDEQWEIIHAVGRHVDEDLRAGDVRLTMGGEPTFVSVDDMEGAEWRIASQGPHKRRLAGELLTRLKHRFAPGGLVHLGQGKWYPDEPLPRWALRCYWRLDGQPIWQDESLLADPTKEGHGTVDNARRFGQLLCEKLGVNTTHVIDGYEDTLYYAWKERRLPANVDVRNSRLENEAERVRLARIFEQGITTPIGCVLPLRRVWWATEPYWESSEWIVRSDELFLIPGDSPMGFRLPIQSLLWPEHSSLDDAGYARDAFADRPALPLYNQLRARTAAHAASNVRQFCPAVVGAEAYATSDATSPHRGYHLGANGGTVESVGPDAVGTNGAGPHADPDERGGVPTATHSSILPDPAGVVRTALCIEPRGGVLHVFLPPVDHLEDYLELIVAIEATAAETAERVVVEGYEPPTDPRLSHIKITPDPGVIEVNVPPGGSWDELVAITTGVYEDAHFSRLGTEKFDLDGTHTGTGGGNHVVLGGPTAADSPFLRRPDLLRSLVGYWHNHPSLSYLFSGSFIGPTSQAPRVDEGRRDARYELEIAFEQASPGLAPSPWLVDRLFRHLLVDGTGNTHRAEFCIDKLFSPDNASGRLGLVEFRAFEMPPHARMSLAQQLLLRACVARFWQEPYSEPLVDWGTTLHDRFMLPHFVGQDFRDVIAELVARGYQLEAEWFAPHFEFRFPKIGDFTYVGVQVDIRKAIEPWYVLGEEGATGGTARYVDSSVERLQVMVGGLIHPRHTVTCNGRKLPLHPTGVEGEYVAGVRYRAWQPPSCLHPTIPIDAPLVFDVLDLWMKRSLGGATYHVGHPGGLNPQTYPINAFEAESRRAGRFFRMGHRGGALDVPHEVLNRDFPLTLDLRRGR